MQFCIVLCCSASTLINLHCSVSTLPLKTKLRNGTYVYNTNPINIKLTEVSEVRIKCFFICLFSEFICYNNIQAQWQAPAVSLPINVALFFCSFTALNLRLIRNYSFNILILISNGKETEFVTQEAERYLG